ncbi:MAG TPA: hypothetical protein VIH48_01255 [Candidatus Bathyarchaeia archaeon]
MAEACGYILRISTKEWVDQVFDMAIYYTSVRRKWKPGQNILFVHKTTVGDALVGYGIIENVLERDALSEEEKHECEQHGWKRAIEFKYVLRFNKPLPVKQTFLKDFRVRGRALHGFPVSKEQFDSVISQAESLQAPI